MQHSGGTALDPLACLGVRNTKNSLEPGHGFVSHHIFPMSILKNPTQPKSLMLTCISLLLTMILYSQYFTAKWDYIVFNLIQNSRWWVVMDYFVSDYDIAVIFLLPHYAQKGWHCSLRGLFFKKGCLCLASASAEH